MYFLLLQGYVRWQLSQIQIQRRQKRFHGVIRSYKSKSGLLTKPGGKWTTYREMAEEAVNNAIEMCILDPKECMTKNLKLHGYFENTDDSTWSYVYGSDVEKIVELIKENKEMRLFHKDYTFTVAHVISAVREEMAQTVEDVLARRVRVLFLDAKAAIEVAPKVASIMAKEMNKPKEWEESTDRNLPILQMDFFLT